MTNKALGLSKEAYFYLQEESNRQRSEIGKPLPERYINRLEDTFDTLKNKDGFYLYTDGDLGGCNGNPHNAWEQGRWTKWSIEEVKKMLDEKCLIYKDGYEKEIVSVIL